MKGSRVASEICTRLKKTADAYEEGDSFGKDAADGVGSGMPHS